MTSNRALQLARGVPSATPKDTCASTAVVPIISAVHPTGEEWLADVRHTLPLVQTITEVKDIMHGEADKARKYPGAIANQAHVLFKRRLQELKEEK